MEQMKSQNLINKLSSTKRLAVVQSRYQKLNPSDDLKTEEILQAQTKTALGQLLGKISQLPEVRYEKISTVRRQISLGEYQIDDKLDASIDRLLEEIFVEL